MSLASNFPDINVSPIRAADEDFSPTPDELQSRLSSQETRRTETCLRNNEKTAETDRDHTCLQGTSVVVSAGCCDDARTEICNKLAELGASVVETIDENTTHLVIDEFVDEQLLKSALHISPAPSIVGIEWVEKCIEDQSRISEHDFSILEMSQMTTGDRELFTFTDDCFTAEIIELSNPEELLKHIRKIVKDLGTLETDFRDWGKWNHRPSECPKSAKSRRFREKMEKFFNVLTQIFNITDTIQKTAKKYPILRRRSHGGYVLEHREEENEILSIREIMKDTRSTLHTSKVPRKEKNPPMKINAKNDMRKTNAADLNQIRATMKRNANIGRSREKKKAKVAQVVIPSTIPLSRDEDLSLAFETLSLGSTQPLVMKHQTKSSLLNNILGQNSVEEFVPSSSGIVFTGFEQKKLKRLKSIANELGIWCSNSVDDPDLTCVVSRKGQRTLAVLYAIVNCVPIVTEQWILDSAKAGIQKTHPFEYEDWAYVIDRRRKDPRIMESLGQVYVSDECDPPAEHLREMIRRSGGRIVKRRSQCDLLVTTEEHSEETTAIVVTPKFIIDCIANNEVPNVEEYQMIY